MVRRSRSRRGGYGPAPAAPANVAQINADFARGTAALRNPNPPAFVAPHGVPGAELARMEQEKRDAAKALNGLPKAAAAAGRRRTRRHRKTNSVRRKTRRSRK